MTDLKGARVGIAMTGSFCTFQSAFSAFEALKAAGAGTVSHSIGKRLLPGHPFRRRPANASTAGGHRGPPKSGTRCNRSNRSAPKKLLDLLVIAPCTGNTLAKLANAIADTSVTMAAKSHLRNSRPVLIGISSNDGLARSARNLGALLAEKHFFFVPFRQDDCNGKPFSLVADLTLLPEAASLALEGKQMQPILR